ncbi:MAG: hypothetical protein RLY31_2407, partial [Bacteroidota bacterium]
MDNSGKYGAYRSTESSGVSTEANYLDFGETYAEKSSSSRTYAQSIRFIAAYSDSL